MVTTIISHFCDICGNKYDSRTSAKKCEKLPILNDDFKVEEFYISDNNIHYLFDKRSVVKFSNPTSHERYYGGLYIQDDTFVDDSISGEELKRDYKVASKKEVATMKVDLLYEYVKTQLNKDFKPVRNLLSKLKKIQKKNL